MQTLAIVSCLLCLCCTVCVWSLKFHKVYTHRRIISSNRRWFSDVSGDTQQDPELNKYLQGQVNLEWRGTRTILKRKKQIPDATYSPQKVVRICMDALGVNDDPQLDHGCCVLLEFKTPDGPLAKNNFDPASYARFIRSSEYSILIDYGSYELLGDPKPIRNGKSMMQKVSVVGFRDGSNPVARRNFDFYLTQIDDKWLIDVVVLSE